MILSWFLAPEFSDGLRWSGGVADIPEHTGHHLQGLSAEALQDVFVGRMLRA